VYYLVSFASSKQRLTAVFIWSFSLIQHKDLQQWILVSFASSTPRWNRFLLAYRNKNIFLIFYERKSLTSFVRLWAGIGHSRKRRCPEVKNLVYNFCFKSTRYCKKWTSLKRLPYQLGYTQQGNGQRKRRFFTSLIKLLTNKQCTGSFRKEGIKSKEIEFSCYNFI